MKGKYFTYKSCLKCNFASAALDWLTQEHADLHTIFLRKSASKTCYFAMLEKRLKLFAKNHVVAMISRFCSIGLYLVTSFVLC